MKKKELEGMNETIKAVVNKFKTENRKIFVVMKFNDNSKYFGYSLIKFLIEVIL